MNEPRMTDAEIIRAIASAEALPLDDRCDALGALWWKTATEDARQAIDAAIVRAITETLSRDERRTMLRYLWWKTAEGSDARRAVENAQRALYEAN